MISVLIVDDSALVRSLLTEMLSSAADLRVVGAAADPYVARDLIKKYHPDVITLDVEMPRMNRLDFLEKLMRLRPMPVLMVSSLTEEGCETTLRALELGAIDFIEKPKIGITEGLTALCDELCAKVRTVAAARVRRLERVVVRAAVRRSTETLFAIGASTGGTEALAQIVSALPPDAPATVVTQHMPPIFTKSFAARLDAIAKVHVVEAVGNERLLPGHVYIAPGDRHLTIAARGSDYITVLDDGPPVNHHRPSVDVLFASVARVAGANAVGAILTGMGADGAQGLLAMHRAGARTIAQDEATSVVFGMPRAAITLRAADLILPLHEIASAAIGGVSRLIRV